LNYNVSGNDGRQWIRINGGNANLNAVAINRAVLNQGGLLIENGVVNSASMRIGFGIAAANSRMDGGVWTNAGAFYIGDRNNPATGSRRTYFVMNGGELVTLGADGIIINNQGQTTLAAPTDDGGTLDINGGTVTAEGVYLNGPLVTANAYARFELSGGTVYLGSLGLIANTAGTDMTAVFTLTGGTLAAKADWASSANLPLTGIVTFKAADAGGVARNITLNGVLSGSGAVIKTGDGALTLNAANTYAGVTTINAGTLALGAAGALANSIQVAVSSGAVFDVAAAGGFTVGAAKSLTGSGTVQGGVAVASGATINPGSNTVTGALTISGALTQTGGAVNHFDLPNSPGPTNDRLVVGGDLNVSGVNTLEVVGGGAPGSVHALIQYGGAFNGTLANFTLVGASGVLTNDTVNKTIGFIVTASVRSPGSVVWVGNSTFNDWDVINRTNWLNGIALDYFVTGDNVLFDAAGAANPIVNIVGNVAPATTTVGAVGNYTLGGTGSIAGTGPLIKTNTGTLTINTVNSYTGPTLISNGVVEVAVVANGSQNSSLGASDNSAANLVVSGGTLSYLGATATTDRAATLGDDGANLGVVSSGTTLTVNGALSGNGKLTKTGDGALVLGTANTYAGGTVVSAGALQFNNASGAGAGGITNNGATLRLNGAIVLNNTFEFNGNCNLQLSGVGGGNVSPRGSWTGSGYVTATFLTQNAAQVLTIGGQGNNGGHMWDFSGTVDFGANDGFLRINNDNSTFNFGSSNATFNIGTGTATLHQRNGSTTTYFGALIGGPNTKLAGRGGTGTSGTTTYEIGGKNLDTTFEGQINNGSGTTAITKVGTGKLTLSGASIHTGATTVSSGTLQLDGSFTGSAITVASSTGSTLAGNGGTDSAVDVQFATYLAPGNNGIGRFSVGSLTLNSGATNLMEIDKANGTNDSVAALNSISYGGVLVVNNLGGTLADGDVFKLFDAPVSSYSGAFESIELPVLTGPNLFWDTTQLTVDGTVRVFTPKPAITAYGVDGNNIYLTGNNGGNTSTHYIVLTATNVTTPANLWTPVVTNAFAFDGSFGFTNAINPATPARFFRVKTP
jgi:fibronectin-binding autotransporter adhesin